ncbi:MAG: glutamate racemase [Bacillota bacterium]
MQIGFFDSGIGGLTVLHEALRILPDEDYIYYADTMNVPYGVKPKEVVRKYIFEAVEFIVQQGVKAVVIACNTATSAAIEDLRKQYNIPIIGMEPAVKPAVEKSRNKNKRVLVTATQLTLKEEKLKNLIARVDDEHIIDLLPLSELVEFCESGEFREEIVLPYLKAQLLQYDMDEYGTIVLGCTHFPFYKDMIEKIVPDDIDIIDGAIGTVNHLKSILADMNRIHDGRGKITFYNSGQQVTDPVGLAKFDKLLDRITRTNERCKRCEIHKK